MSKSEEKTVEVATNTAELRRFLLRQMESVARGEQPPAVARMVCNYAQQVYNTVNVELRVAQAKVGKDSLNIAPVDF